LFEITESSGKHETGRNEREKYDPTCNEVQDANPAYFVGVCGCSGWKTK
jgi:hypothetical protein